MRKRPPLVAFLLAVGTVIYCSTERGPAGSTSVMRSAVAGTVCATESDLAMNVTLVEDSCDELEGGFQDQTGAFSYTFDLVQSVNPGETLVLATFEHRFVSATEFGIRKVDARLQDPTSSNTRESGRFQLTFPRELAASEFVGYTAKCPTDDDTSQNADTCWTKADPGTIHLEPRVCIDNTLDATYADAAERCADPNPPDISRDPNLNRLPDSEARANELQRTSTSATWQFDARSSSDPEGAGLSYGWELWRLLGGRRTFIRASSEPLFDHTFTAEGTYAARLVALDPAGGLDLAAVTFQVSFLPPESLSAQINGPAFVPANHMCIWLSQVEGGTSPYAYEWRRDDILVGTAASYDAGTGTQDFFLRLDVQSQDGQTAWDTLSVVVNPLMDDCPSVD